jgi:hypothetical protein
MSDIVDLPLITKLDIDPQRVLTKALEQGMTDVIIIGYDSEGVEYFASSMADGGHALWHLERAKLKLLREAD